MTNVLNKTTTALVAVGFWMHITSAGALAEVVELSPVSVDPKGIENDKDKMVSPSSSFLQPAGSVGLSGADFKLGESVAVTSLTANGTTVWIGAAADKDGLKKYAMLSEGKEAQVKDGPTNTWSRSYTDFLVPSEDGATSVPLYVRATGNPPVALRYFVPLYFEGKWTPAGGDSIKVGVYGSDPQDPTKSKLLLDLDGDGLYRFKSPTMEVRELGEPFRLNGNGYSTSVGSDMKTLEFYEAETDAPELAVLRFGATAPDWSATDFEGNPVKLSDFRGKFVFFDVWATWCGPCIGEIPHIQAAQEKYGDKVEIIGVSIDSDSESAKKMVADKKLTYKQLWAPDEFQSAICQQYQVDGIPATFLVDPEGKLVSNGIRGDAIEKSMEMASKIETAEAKVYFAESAERAEAFQKVERMVESGEKAQAVALLKALKQKHKDPTGLEALDRYLKFMEDD